MIEGQIFIGQETAFGFLTCIYSLGRLFEVPNVAQGLFA